YVGSQSINAYLNNETGRLVQWARRYAGEIEMVVGSSGSGPITYTEALYILTDINAQGRLLQSIKTALRDPDYDDTLIFERFYSIDELICLILSELKARSEAQLDETCDSIVLGRPVKFSE